MDNNIECRRSVLLFFNPFIHFYAFSTWFLSHIERSHVGILIKVLDLGQVAVLWRRPLARRLGDLTSSGVGREMRARSGASVGVAAPVVTARRQQ